MAFFNFRKNVDKRKHCTLVCTSEPLINPLYKPKTLGELKALFTHTGINPAPVALRQPVPENDVFDPMDTPSVDLSGDPFESRRKSASLTDKLKDAERSYESSKPKPKTDPSLDGGSQD